MAHRKDAELPEYTNPWGEADELGAIVSAALDQDIGALKAKKAKAAADKAGQVTAAREARLAKSKQVDDKLSAATAAPAASGAKAGAKAGADRDRDR